MNMAGPTIMPSVVTLIANPQKIRPFKNCNRLGQMREVYACLPSLSRDLFGLFLALSTPYGLCAAQNSTDVGDLGKTIMYEVAKPGLTLAGWTSGIPVATVTAPLTRSGEQTPKADPRLTSSKRRSAAGRIRDAGSRLQSLTAKLKHGGSDDPSNMLWQTKAEARAKDRVE